MLHKAPLPRMFFLRAVVVAMVLTALHALGFSSLSISNTRVSAAPPLAPPSNDNFGDAQPMLGVSGVVFGTTLGATKEPLEQAIVGVTGTGSVWYKWQAPFSGRFVFMTSDDSGNEFDTLLGVYSGANLPGIQVSANDDDLLRCRTIKSLPSLSRVSFDAVGGLVYHISVDTKGTGGGSFKLRWGLSATITVQARSVSLGSTGGAAGGAKLEGDMCTSLPSIFTFSGIPTGGSYTVSIIPSDPLQGYGFSPAKENGSTSPLSGDITLLFRLVSPAKTISGRVTNLPSPITGLTVTCVSTNGAFWTQTGKITPHGTEAIFECGSLPINAEYLVTPSKLGFSFAPVDATVMLFSGDKDITANPFVASPAPPHTISGRITLPNGVTGLSDVTVALSGDQTESMVSDTTGNYSFTVPHGGTYSITPSHPNFTLTPSSRNFPNVTTIQSGDFVANFSLPLILDDMGQLVALDSMLHTRDPFPVINNANVLNQGADRNTRVAILVSNFQLGPGELSSSVMINLVGSDNQTYDIPAEDVRPTSNPAFTQIIFKLPDTLAPGTCTLFVKAHGFTSNIALITIKV